MEVKGVHVYEFGSQHHVETFIPLGIHVKMRIALSAAQFRNWQPPSSDVNIRVDIIDTEQNIALVKKTKQYLTQVDKIVMHVVHDTAPEVMMNSWLKELHKRLNCDELKEIYKCLLARLRC
jgi:hypothetical protein